MAAVSGVERHAASFRDPAGFVFEHHGEILRAVHPDAVGDVDALFSSGLHDELAKDGLLVPHQKVAPTVASMLPAGWMLLRADRLPVISYASEWTAAQLQAAAFLTLDLQRRALKRGLSLKDASAFNVQFDGARPVFIDLLSFTRIEPGRAWPAYRQFCQHFLAPLALRRHIPESLIANIGLEGIPLTLASRLLPARTWFRPALALHVHLHARAAAARHDIKQANDRAVNAQAAVDFRLQLVESLVAAVRCIGTRVQTSHWVDYRHNNVYSADSAGSKRRFVEEAVARSGARRALDLGANDGYYARALVDLQVACTAVEVDPACCEQIYASSLQRPYNRLLNTVRVDLTNPSPAHGWAHEERASFSQRMRCDLTLALALVHHLSITHQIPFDKIARFLAELAPNAVVEYVPITDPMVQQLLAARTGVTASYLETLTETSFRSAFLAHFECQDSQSLGGGRVLHHFLQRA